MKTSLPPGLIHGGFIVLLAIVLVSGWWLAGGDERGRAMPPAPRLATNKGPIEPSFCAPDTPRPPPPMDSPFGFHLYAHRAKGVIYALPAMIIAEQLAPPEKGSNEAAKPALAAGGLNPAEPKNETAYDDVQSVSNLLQEYRRSFGAMPVGELNDEIVRRLQGENPQGIAVLPKTHPSINADGELIDRWGSPYRFHPESAWQMTVRSAGPDRKMWTSDDIMSELEPGAVQL